MDDLSFYIAQLIDGIAYGSIYGIFALSIVLLFRANKLFNFAQTQIATLFVMFALIFMRKFSFPTAILITLALSFVSGIVLHLTAMRFITERRNVLHSNESVMTIGFFTISNSLASYFFGDDPQPFPSPFKEGVFTVTKVGISYHSLGILLVSIFMAVGLFLCFKLTRLGLVFEAVAENIVAARLRGIRASNVLALAWGFTIMTSTLGGMLIAPILFVTPGMLINIYAYSLIAVVIGGLESPIGALVGGVLVGVVENLASNLPMIGSELKFVVVMMLVLVVLVVRPRGLWGRAEGRRV